MTNTEARRTRPEVFDEEKYANLLLRIAMCHRENKPTLDEMKRALAAAHDEAQHYMGAFSQVAALEILLRKLNEGYGYLGIAQLALTFWWFNGNRDKAHNAARNAVGLPNN